MENWFRSLSKRELRTWVKNLDQPMAKFFNSVKEEDIKTAKRILKEKRRK